ncbi:MAG: tubulin-like doman-containing protein [Pirellulaceae bacterium]
MTQAHTEVQTPGAHRSEPIPGYHLRERIGAGGYGEVWSAEAPGQLIKAIKFVYGFLEQDRASRELKALNRIKGVRHPFLLSLERIEVVDGQLIIVTELADASLKDRFEECVKSGLVGIPRKELLAHLHDAADALDYMNAQHSLQHLDVKPENLLLVGGRIKVADFGLVKDMQDTSASLMGGLTPIYAPPEVFDARPSRRSDQYSLAIVFQEMLTGIVPFPGKSAAQLAMQHLNAKPRLGALPEGDQPIIAQALAKDPAQRFGSCVELVEALLHVASEASDKAPAAAPASCAPNLGATASFTGHSPPASTLNSAALDSQPLGQETLRRLDSMAQAVQRLAEGSCSQAERSALAATIDRPYQAAPATALIDLPPLEIDLAANACRPTLFLGIGGLAGKTLQQLRRRLDDRCDAKQLGTFQFLLLDTDSHELMDATHGQCGSPIHPQETLALPLRKSADYRNDSRKFLDWLSRRWLFNIPRSQQTEGIRPFGRLAFVDHGEEVMQRLRRAVELLMEAGKSGGEAAPPRIVVLGSSSGGAASGMVLDVAFAAHQTLQERAKDGMVDLLLLYGASRQPAAQELAAVNTFSLLTELNHYLRPGGIFPDDPAIGLQSCSAGESPLANTYLVHLGQDLSPEQFLAATDRVAEYLYLDAATPTGNYLRACRSAKPHEQRHDVTLRTFGLCPLGFSDALVAGAAESLCQTVLRRWSGEPKPTVESSLSARRDDAAASAASQAAAARDAELERLTAHQSQQLGLELDSLIEGLYALAVEELGGEPDVVFRKIARASPGAPQGMAPVDKWFADIACFFGPRLGDGDSSPTSPLHNALLKRLPQAIAPLGQRLRDWLLALPEDPAARVSGAHKCVKLFQGHLKGISEKAKETRTQISGQIAGIEQRLALAARSPAKPSGRNKDGPTLAESLFLQHCQFRIYQLAAQVAAQFAQNLGGFVSQAADQLHDLTRDLKHMTGQFAPIEAAPGSDDLEQIAMAQLQKDEDESALRIDQTFQQQLFATAGFRTTLLQGGDGRRDLLALLRQQARQATLASLRQIDLSALLKELGKPGQNGPSRLEARIATAQPWMQQVGGERRLLCVVAPGSGYSDGQSLTPAELSGLIGKAYFEQIPAVIPAATSQIVFCYELGNVPLSHAAARLIDHCPQYAQAATRLHVRTDVTWQELPV